MRPRLRLALALACLLIIHEFTLRLLIDHEVAGALLAVGGGAGTLLAAGLALLLRLATITVIACVPALTLGLLLRHRSARRATMNRLR